MLYLVSLSPQAESDYDELYDQAQRCPDDGDDTHPAVIRFEEVQHALDETLTLDARDSKRQLAGRVSFLYVLNLNTVTITYTVVDDPEPTVVVQGIVERDDKVWVRDWLDKKVENGELLPLLQKLGINPYLAKVQVSSSRFH